MSALPKLRPFTGNVTMAQSARPPPFSSRRNFILLKNEKKSVTEEELVFLKQKKAALSEELRLSIVKVVRGRTAATGKRDHSADEKISVSIENENSQLKQSIRERRRQIREVEACDIAGSISELREETKILFLELKRLNLIKEEKLGTYNASLRKAEMFQEQYSEERLENMRNFIENFKNEISNMKKKNDEYEKRIEAINKNNSEIEANGGHPDLHAQIDELKKSIKAAAKRVKEQSENATTGNGQALF